MVGRDNSDPQISWIMVVSNVSADKSDLEALYEANKDREADEYTETSWLAFETALLEVARILADEDATQADIEQANRNFAQAIDLLVKADLEGEESQEDQDDPEDKEDQAGSEAEEDQEDQGDSQVKEDQDDQDDLSNQLPDTSTSLFNYLLIGLLLVMVGVISIKSVGENGKKE